MLKLMDVSKTYQSNKNVKVQALDKINLLFPKTGMVFVAGKSGSGKSTLLNIIGGLDAYDDGEITINGKSTRDFSATEYDAYRNTYIGFVFQEYNLIETFTVKKNVLIAAELQNKQISDAEVEFLLERLDLKGLASRMPNELSGGQRQRVAIARALIKKPQIILADEPTGSLDSDTSHQILKVLKNLSQEKLVIVVSHDLGFANQYADRIILIKDGSIEKDETKLREKNSGNDYAVESISSHFSMLNVLKFAWKDFLVKPARLVFLTLLLSISFMLFGLMHTISTYDIAKNTNESMERTGIDYIMLEHAHYVTGQDGATYMMSPRFSNQEVNNLKNLYPNQLFFPIISGYNSNIYDLYEANSDTFNFPYITGAVELSSQLIQNFQLTLLAGEYPKPSLYENEVAISKQIYNLFQKNGYRGANGVKIYINQPDDLIGRYITVQDKNVIITGIIDTNYDDTRYESILNNNSSELSSDILLNELIALNEYGIHNLLFLREHYIQDVLQHPSRINTYYNQEIGFRLYLENPDSENFREKVYAEFDKLSVLKSLPERIYWKDGIEREILNTNEILLPISTIPSDIGIGELRPFFELKFEEINELIDEFAYHHFEEIRVDFEQNFGSSDYTDYAFYIKNAVENAFHPENDYQYFQYKAEEDLLNRFYFDKFNHLLLDGSYKFYNDAYHVEVVGFYADVTFQSWSEDIPLIFSDALFNQISHDFSLYDYDRILINLADDTILNEDIIKLGFDETSNPHFMIYNEIVITIRYINELLEQISVFMFFSGAVFALFSAILLYGYLNLIINSRQKDIGILRALGATKMDIMRIFVIEGLMIALSSVLISSIGGLIASEIANDVLLNNYGMIVSILNFGVLQIILISAIAVMITMIATFIPVYRFSKKKPIDVIKGL